MSLRSRLDLLIVANRTGTFDPSIESDGRRFVRERVVEPGLARYRLAGSVERGFSPAWSLQARLDPRRG